MSPRPPQGSTAANQHAYIPAGAQQALAQKMQQATPAHLKQYVGPNAPAYVPQRVQEQLTAQMQKALPSHLQQYAGAYVQQNVVNPSLRTPLATHTTSTFIPPKAINPRNLSHSGNVGSAQADATELLNLFQPEHQRPTGTQSTAGPSQNFTTPSAETTEPSPLAPAPTPPPQPQSPPQYPAGQLSQPYDPTAISPPPDPSHYDFIMNPADRPKSSLFGGGNSLITRVAVLAGVATVLLIAVIVGSSLIKGSNTSTPSLITVAQEQTELLRVAALANQHTPTPATVQLSNSITINLMSAQNQTFAYLSKNHVKVDPKVLALKHSAADDSTLAAAVATSNFDAAFKQVIQTDLNNYSADLKVAYKATSGPKGRALLQKLYNGAALLQEQTK